ncbi:MAG: hypothetical protein H6Q15_2085 [Bacteroidetes bacterium]|nr:hypothetical protein [Bacteroidota bacterium]
MTRYVSIQATLLYIYRLKGFRELALGEALLEWLRDEHHIHIVINVKSAGDDVDKPIWYYSYVNRFDNCMSDEAFNYLSDEKFDSYEEALNASLRTVKDLI